MGFELTRVFYKSIIPSFLKKCMTKKVSDKCLTIKYHESVVNIRGFMERGRFESIPIPYESSID
jgi:hypothetical protein